MKKILSVVIAMVLIGGGVWGCFSYKKHEVKEAVHEYLIKKGTQENQIKVLDPFIANLEGDKNLLVAVRLKNDKKTYYYYKDQSKNKVVLESYTLNGQEYVQ